MSIIQHFGYTTKVSSIFQWIELVVKCNRPLSDVDNPCFRKYMKHPPISRKILRKYIIALAEHICTTKIAPSMAPSKLCISYDVTSIGGDLHVVAVYAHWLVRPQGLDDSANDFLATTKCNRNS
jgi:hypothetical protein